MEPAVSNARMTSFIAIVEISAGLPVLAIFLRFRHMPARPSGGSVSA